MHCFSHSELDGGLGSDGSPPGLVAGPSWSSELAIAAVAAITEATIGPLQEELADTDPCVFVIEYCDGFKANFLGLGSWSVPRNIDDGQCAASPPSSRIITPTCQCIACNLRSFAPQTAS